MIVNHAILGSIVQKLVKLHRCWTAILAFIAQAVLPYQILLVSTIPYEFQNHTGTFDYNNLLACVKIICLYCDLTNYYYFLLKCCIWCFMVFDNFSQTMQVRVVMFAQSDIIVLPVHLFRKIVFPEVTVT